MYSQYNHLRTKKSLDTSTPSSRSFLLNALLTLGIFIYVLSAINFFRCEDEMIFTQMKPSLSQINSMKKISGSEKTFYYDYERYLQINKTQTSDQFYYIDLGCFDGRDIEQFIHFHSEEEILQTRNLTIITFEPDPINYATCKSKQEQSTSIPKTIHNLAAWTKNDRVQYAIERGEKSRIDQNSTSYVHAIDFSQWLLKNFKPENYLYIKFTVDGAEIAILEKMIADRSLALVDYLEIEWTFPTSADFEPRRVSIEGMFDNFGIDYLYMIDPSDTERVYRTNESYTAVHKDHGWKLNTSSIRFHYQARKEVATLLHERLKRRR